MNNAVLSAIADRRSIRGYTPDALTKEQLDALIKAALESPSARNSQPWHFTVVSKGNPVLDIINDEIAKGLERERTDVFYAAPTVIFISCEEGNFSMLDSGIAVQTLALAAHSMGLGSVILGMPRIALTGEKSAEIAATLKFPEGHSFAIAIAIGTPATTKDAHPILEGKVDIIS